MLVPAESDLPDQIEQNLNEIIQSNLQALHDDEKQSVLRWIALFQAGVLEDLKANIVIESQDDSVDHIQKEIQNLKSDIHLTESSRLNSIDPVDQELEAEVQMLEAELQRRLERLHDEQKRTRETILEYIEAKLRQLVPPDIDIDTTADGDQSTLPTRRAPGRFHLSGRNLGARREGESGASGLRNVEIEASLAAAVEKVRVTLAQLDDLCGSEVPYLRTKIQQTVQVLQQLQQSVDKPSAVDVALRRDPAILQMPSLNELEASLSSQPTQPQIET